jgi:hypothetical protein
MRTKRRQSSTVVRRIGVGLVACAVLAITACQDATSPGDFLPGLSIRTDAETIHFVPFGGANLITVAITVTNHSDKTLNLAYCGEVLERFTVQGWVMVYAPVCIASLQTLPPIPVGTSLAFTVHAYDGSGQNPGFRFTDSPNVYRVTLSLWMVEDGRAEPLPRDARATNPFYVEP